MYVYCNLETSQIYLMFQLMGSSQRLFQYRSVGINKLLVSSRFNAQMTQQRFVCNVIRQNRFNKSFDFGQYLTNSDLIKVGSTHGLLPSHWANRYEYIESNETRSTSHRDLYFAETSSILHRKSKLVLKRFYLHCTQLFIKVCVRVQIILIDHFFFLLQCIIAKFLCVLAKVDG